MSRRNKNVHIKWDNSFVIAWDKASVSHWDVWVRGSRLYSLDHRDYWVPAMLLFSRMKLSTIKGDVAYGRKKNQPLYSSPKAKFNKKPHKPPFWSVNPYQMKQLKRR